MTTNGFTNQEFSFLKTKVNKTTRELGDAIEQLEEEVAARVLEPWEPATITKVSNNEIDITVNDFTLFVLQHNEPAGTNTNAEVHLVFEDDTRSAAWAPRYISTSNSVNGFYIIRQPEGFLCFMTGSTANLYTLAGTKKVKKINIKCTGAFTTLEATDIKAYTKNYSN